jgi:hypothetical protein
VHVLFYVWMPFRYDCVVGKTLKLTVEKLASGICLARSRNTDLLVHHCFFPIFVHHCRASIFCIAVMLSCFQIDVDTKKKRDINSKLLRAALSTDVTAVQATREFLAFVPDDSDHQGHITGPVRALLFTVCPSCCMFIYLNGLMWLIGTWFVYSNCFVSG